MARGRARRWNGWIIAAMAVLLLGTGGPSLALSDLDLHVGLGIGLAVVTSGHLWLHRTRALAWLPGRRLRHRRGSWRRRLVRGQDGVREVAFVLTVLTGFLLLAGEAGETLHVLAGFSLLALAVVHVALHHEWFGRRLRGWRRVSQRSGARP